MTTYVEITQCDIWSRGIRVNRFLAVEGYEMKVSVEYVPTTQKESNE